MIGLLIVGVWLAIVLAHAIGYESRVRVACIIDSSKLPALSDADMRRMLNAGPMISEKQFKAEMYGSWPVFPPVPDECYGWYEPKVMGDTLNDIHLTRLKR